MTTMTRDDWKEADRHHFAGCTDDELYKLISKSAADLVSYAANGGYAYTSGIRSMVGRLSLGADELEYRQAKAVVTHHEVRKPRKIERPWTSQDEAAMACMVASGMSAPSSFH